MSWLKIESENKSTFLDTPNSEAGKKNLSQPSIYRQNEESLIINLKSDLDKPKFEMLRFKVQCEFKL